MKTPTPQNDPIEERIKYHMACIDARKNNLPEPEAPWRKQPSRERLGHTLDGLDGTLSDLTLPERPQRRSTARPPAPKAPSSSKHTRSFATTTPRISESVTKTSEPASPMPMQPARTLLNSLPRTELKPIALLEQKSVLIESLLLRSGLLPTAIREQNLVNAVLDGYRDYERKGGEQSKTSIVQRYEVVRHFYQSGMSHFSELAEVLIPLLQACDLKELTNSRLRAEETIERIQSFTRPQHRN